MHWDQVRLPLHATSDQRTTGGLARSSASGVLSKQIDNSLIRSVYLYQMARWLLRMFKGALPSNRGRDHCSFSPTKEEHVTPWLCWWRPPPYMHGDEEANRVVEGVRLRAHRREEEFNGVSSIKKARLGDPQMSLWTRRCYTVGQVATL